VVQTGLGRFLGTPWSVKWSLARSSRPGEHRRRDDKAEIQASTLD
jgi:hypothetical protein